MTAIAANRPFEILVDQRLVMRVTAMTPEDAINKWIDMEGAASLADAAQLYYVEPSEIVANPVEFGPEHSVSLAMRGPRPV